MSEAELAKQLSLLPDYLGNHLLLSLSALGLSILICLPLAILVARVAALQWPVLTFAAVLQTVPGIALLALMVPLLGQIGFLPAFIALVLYSMLPILRNTVTGILGIEPTMIEAAKGVGMTARQQLILVELPLALPVIIAGIRTAAVWVVGMATLSTPVGATSLGNYIFAGLQTQNFAAVLVGCVAAALLAIVLDQSIRLLELAAAKRRTSLAVFGSGLLLGLIAAGFVPWVMKSATTKPAVIVGAKTFTEQYILADLISQRLAASGFAVETKSGLGSTVAFDALAANSIQCYVDYTGTLWANVMHRSDLLPKNEMMQQIRSFLEREYGIVLLGGLGFENTYALALPESTAHRLHISSMEDLAVHARRLTIGSDYEFFSRPEWRSLQETYNLRFAGLRTFDPTLMYAAVRENQVDVISAYSTDGRIVEYNLRVLTDPRQALPPYDAVLVISSEAARDSQLVNALRDLIGSIPNEAMRRANRMVDLEKQSVRDAATYLVTKGRMK